MKETVYLLFISRLLSKVRFFVFPTILSGQAVFSSNGKNENTVSLLNLRQGLRELPECIADGSSYIEAVENAEIVINEWIELAKEQGRPLPEPKGKLMFA